MRWAQLGMQNPSQSIGSVSAIPLNIGGIRDNADRPGTGARTGSDHDRAVHHVATHQSHSLRRGAPASVRPDRTTHCYSRENVCPATPATIAKRRAPLPPYSARATVLSDNHLRWEPTHCGPTQPHWPMAVERAEPAESPGAESATEVRSAPTQSIAALDDPPELASAKFGMTTRSSDNKSTISTRRHHTRAAAGLA